MSKKANIYSGNQKIGEIHETPDYEGALAAGIVGCVVQIVVYALIGIFVLTWRYPKVMLPLLAVIVASSILSNSGYSLNMGTAARTIPRAAASTGAAATTTSGAVASTGTSLAGNTAAQITGKVTSNGLNVRTDPGVESSITSKLSKGQKVIVQGRNEDGDWLKIAINNTTGWVSTKYIALSDPLANIPVLAATIAPTTTSPASMPENGMWIMEVEAGSESASANLHAGQILVSLNGNVARDVQTVKEIVTRNIGTPITAVLWKDGKELTIRITPNDRSIGLTLCQLSRCPQGRYP